MTVGIFVGIILVLGIAITHYLMYKSGYSAGHIIGFDDGYDKCINDTKKKDVA